MTISDCTLGLSQSYSYFSDNISHVLVNLSQGKDENIYRIIVACTWPNLTCTIESLLLNVSMTRHNSQDKVKCHAWLTNDLSMTRNLGKISWPILTSSWLQMLTEKLWLDYDIHGTWDFHMTFSDYAWTWNFE